MAVVVGEGRLDDLVDGAFATLVLSDDHHADVVRQDGRWRCIITEVDDHPPEVAHLMPTGVGEPARALRVSTVHPRPRGALGADHACDVTRKSEQPWAERTFCVRPQSNLELDRHV